MVLHPRHRGDCAEFFVATDQTKPMIFAGTKDVLAELEHAAALAGRTWNDQVNYVMRICLGRRQPDFDDGRSV
ncbi:MAG: hypothetical protein ABI684_15380 [Nitrospirota bacterium]